MAVDSHGNLYIADAVNKVIERVTPGGILSIFAGTGTYGAPTPGPATSSNLKAAQGVSVDAAGNVYIADTNNSMIEKVNGSGILSFVAGTGTAGSTTPGPALASELQYPTQVAVDSAGNVFIADNSNNQIDEVNTAGILSVIAGNGAGGPPTAGLATASSLDSPNSVAVDSAGNIFVADTYNNVVEEITGGQLRFIAGDGNQNPTVPGPALQTSLSYPSGIAIAANSRDLFVTDDLASVVDELHPASTAPTAPTRLKATPGKNSAHVSFTAPADNGGSAITGYQYSLDGGKTWHSLSYTGTTAVTGTISGLTAGTKVTVVVRAVNSIGPGPASASSTVQLAKPISEPTPTPKATASASSAPSANSAPAAPQVAAAGNSTTVANTGARPGGLLALGGALLASGTAVSALATRSRRGQVR